MRRMVRALAAAVLTAIALGAVAVAGAAAAEFEASETGSVSGAALTPAVFGTSAGEIRCTTATASGAVTAQLSESLKVVVEYGGCTAFGLVPATVSPAEYRLNAAGTEDVLNAITFSVPFAGCSVSVGPQTARGSVVYGSSGNDLVVSSSVTGVAYPGSGGLCGSGGTNGSFVGSEDLSLNGGAGALALAESALSAEVRENAIPVKVCELEFETEQCMFTVEALKNGMKVEKAELKGIEANKRWKNAEPGCTVGTVLNKGESCSDVIELIKEEPKSENEWCLKWSKTVKPECFQLIQP
jgi:hypothetical protein